MSNRRFIGRVDVECGTSSVAMTNWVITFANLVRSYVTALFDRVYFNPDSPVRLH